MRNFNDRGFGGRGGFGRNTGGSSEMHQAVCSDCGRNCEVPFKPMHNKPVYCNDCFRKDGDSRSSDSRPSSRPSFGKPERRDFGRPSYEDKRMHGATCAECGERCEVPFRPTGDKPVYCSNCFGDNKGGNFESKKSFSSPQKSGSSNDQFEQMNKKLDKIIKALEIVMQKKEFIIEKPRKESEIVESKVEPKVDKKTSKKEKKVVESKPEKVSKVVKPKKKSKA